jgi:hypothetical protein
MRLIADIFIYNWYIFYLNANFVQLLYVIYYQVKLHRLSLLLIDEHLHYLQDIVNFIIIIVNGFFVRII